MSSFLIAAPEALAAASADLSGIGEAIRAARASAAPATTVIAPAAADEVSAAITRLLGDYAADFQALSARTATFHVGFVQTLLHSASAFAGTEAANGSSLQTPEAGSAGLDQRALLRVDRAPADRPRCPRDPRDADESELAGQPRLRSGRPVGVGLQRGDHSGLDGDRHPDRDPLRHPARDSSVRDSDSRTCRSSWAFHNTRPRAAATISPAADPWPRPPSAKPSISPERPERRTR